MRVALELHQVLDLAITRAHVLDALHLFRWSVDVLAARLRHESLEGRMQRSAVAARHVDERADSRVRSQRAPRRLFVEVFHQGGARVAQQPAARAEGGAGGPRKGCGRGVAIGKGGAMRGRVKVGTRSGYG